MNPSGHIVVIRRDGTDGLTCDWCSPLCDIGSNQSCDIRVQHSTVAPFHCTLQLLKDGLVQAVSRVDGRYKMLVNNFPLNDACVLTDNCILTVGDRQFRFFYPPLRSFRQDRVSIISELLETLFCLKDFRLLTDRKLDATTDHQHSRKTTSDDYLYEASSKASSHYNKEEVLTPTSLPLVHPSKRTTPRKILLNHKTRSPRQRSMTPKRTLGTSERYGPVPPRQPATPPIIQVLRHEPNSSQSNKLPVFQAENVESNKKSVSGGKGYSYTDVNVSKSNQLKSSVVPDLPNAAHHPSSSVLSSIKGRSQNRIHTPFITSTLPNDDLNFTPNENKRSPGFRKSFHKLLILNESSNQSNLCKIDQFYDELSYVKQQAIESKRSPSTGQENQFCYDKCINDPTEESSREYIPELLTSPNSQRITRKSLSAKSSQKISIAYSPETEQELINRNRKRTISGKTYPTAEDMLATKRRRGVSFGPPLSPERFDKSLPPSTPVKRGGTPLVKLSHSTPANHSLQVNSVVWHSATPFASKLSELSQLSAFSKTTCESPNYNVTNNRVSAVISLPPTPDTNLLNSLSTDISCTHESFATLPVTSAAYSAPIKKSKINRKNLKRHSIAFLEKTSKTPSLRVPPTSPVSTKQKDKKQSTNEQRAKYQEKRAQSFDTNNNKTYNNNNYNKLYSSASYSLPNITKEYKQRRRTSSVPPTNLTETEAVTPEMSLSSVRKESGLTGVRKLLKTPKSVQTPRVSGVSELFKDEPSVKRHRGRPSSVPPTDLTETEAVTPEMSLSSVRKESGLTGVRKLLKTPKSVQTPRVSGVSELFKDEPSVKRHRGRPSSVPPTDLTETEAVTPEMSLSSVRKESGLTGVRKLLKTPKSVQTPRVSGVSELFKDEPSGNVCYRVQNVSNVTSLSPSYCKLCRCLLFECQCSFGFNNLTGKRSRRRGLDDVAESLPSKRTRCVFKIAESSVVKSTDADYPVMKMSSRRLKYPSTNELTVQLSKTKSKNKKQVSTMGSQYSDALTDRSVNIVKSLENRTSKELPGLIIPLPNNVMGNNSRKRKSIPYKSRLTPSDNMLNSYDQSAPSNTVSLIPKTAKDRESVSVVPVAKRLRSRMTPSVIECLSSSRTRRAVKVPDSLIGESATTDSSGKSSMVKTSSRKVKSQSNKEVIIQPSKTISKTKKKVSSTDFQCPDSLLDHSVNAVKSTNNCASKRSIKRLADVRRVSPSIPLAKRLRNRIDQSDIKCVTSEHTRNEETSLPVKDQPSEKKRNGTKTNNLRNRKQVITSPSKPLPTASSSKSVSTNESKDITLKSKTRSRHIKRASVTPVDNITNVSPKRRVLRSWKVITPASEISQPIQEKISTSKITNKSKLKTTNNNSNNNSSVTSKSTQAKQSSISIRQTRSRTRQ
ncbi:hypothetical protein Smp_158930 [Schistosoma mansoni]|uniref:hypothetical protein n=1 Tax=Schistosoma mansoni TaxID=6183 RepID=UPI00022DC037|nr:hypothetical protein Smp_158930 [Schistosoma mansoni]|eukprot:XP_018651620.1 hypothetical protein Smp_158930 [Schistosoma mansoni]